MGDTAAALAESNIVAMRCSNSSGRHGFWINCKERLIFEVVVQRVGAVVAAKQYGDFWLDTGYQFAGFGAARDRNRHVHQYEADLPGLFLEELDGLSSVGSGQHLIAGFAEDFLGEGAHVIFVLDDQVASRCQRRFGRCDFLRVGGGFIPGGGEVDVEGDAPVRLAVELDESLMLLDDAERDGQAESDAFVVFGFGAENGSKMWSRVVLSMPQPVFPMVRIT